MSIILKSKSERSCVVLDYEADTIPDDTAVSLMERQPTTTTLQPKNNLATCMTGEGLSMPVNHVYPQPELVRTKRLFAAGSNSNKTVQKQEPLDIVFTLDDNNKNATTPRDKSKQQSILKAARNEHWFNDNRRFLFIVIVIVISIIENNSFIITLQIQTGSQISQNQCFDTLCSTMV